MSGFGDWVNENANWLGPVIGGFIGSQDGESTTTTTAPYLFQGQEEGITNFLNAAKTQYQDGPQAYYPGQTVASLDPNTINAQNTALGTIPGQQQMADATALGAGHLLNGGAGRIGGFNMQDQVGFGIDQGLQNAVMNPIMDNLEQRVLPGLDLAATSQGAFGGTRQGQMKANAAATAVGQASDAVARANLQARGQSIQQRQGDHNTILQGRGQDINQNSIENSAVQSGINAAGMAQDALLKPSDIMAGVGKQRTGYEQTLIDADMDRFNFNQQAAIDSVDRLGERMNLAPTGNIQTIPGQKADWMSILGGAATGSQIARQFMPVTPPAAPAQPNPWANFP